MIAAAKKHTDHKGYIHRRTDVLWRAVKWWARRNGHKYESGHIVGFPPM